MPTAIETLNWNVFNNTNAQTSIAINAGDTLRGSLIYTATKTSSPGALTVNLQASNDGILWINIGSATHVSTATGYEIIYTKPYTFLRVQISAGTGTNTNNYWTVSSMTLSRFWLKTSQPEMIRPSYSGTYVVDPRGLGDFTDIQSAIDACDGVTPTTIIITPGHYPEQITEADNVFLFPLGKVTYLGMNNEVIAMPLAGSTVTVENQEYTQGGITYFAHRYAPQLITSTSFVTFGSDVFTAAPVARSATLIIGFRKSSGSSSNPELRLKVEACLEEPYISTTYLSPVHSSLNDYVVGTNDSTTYAFVQIPLTTYLPNFPFKLSARVTTSGHRIDTYAMIVWRP